MQRMIKSRRLRDAVAVGLLVLFTAAEVLAQEPQAEEPQVVIVDSTNSLLVNATAEQHLQIAVIIGYVDSVPEAAAIPYVVYPLENQDPEDLYSVLDRLIRETVTQTGEKGAKIVTTTKRLEEDIIVIPDAKTYSLIVYASKRNQQWISSLIKQLDEYRPQVLLDVTLVEIRKNDDFTLTLKWLSSLPDLTDTSGLTSPIMAVTDTQTNPWSSAGNKSNIVEKLTSSVRDRFIDFSSSGTGFYADEHINFLLTAVQTKGYGRVLARPKLLVNDNEKGTIKTLRTQYIVRQDTKILAGAGVGTSTTASSVNFEKYDAGITLDIEPHISKGDQLRLKISLARTDFGEPATAKVTDPTTGEVREIEKPPEQVTSDVQTTITVPDGKTIILGGLEKIKQSKGGTKVPILGDIPFIGGLFRNTQNRDEQTRLYVFVKAHILRPGEEVTGVSDVEIVSAKNRATFEKYEAEMQKYENWPGIKPKPMDPVRVLEAD